MHGAPIDARRPWTAPAPIAPADPLEGGESAGALHSLGLLAAGLFLFFDYSRVLDVAIIKGSPVIGAFHLPLLLNLFAVATTIVIGRGRYWMTWPAGKRLLGYTACVALSVPGSVWRHASFDVLTLNWSMALCMLTFTAGLPNTGKALRRLAVTVALAAVLLAVMALKLGSMESGRLYFMYEGRFSNPNDLAQALLMGFPFLWLATHKESNILLRALALAGIIPVALAIVKTGSRGGIVAVFVMGVVYFWHATPARRLALVLGTLVAVILCAAFMSDVIRLRYKTMLGAEDPEDPETMTMQHAFAVSSTANRRYLLQESLLLTARRPIFGGGAGTFRVMLADEMVKTHVWGAHRDSHNTYTQISSEDGIPALLFYVAALVACFRSAGKIFREARGADPPLANLALAVQLSITSYAASAMFNSLAYDTHFPILAGFALALSGIARTRLAAGAAQPAPEPLQGKENPWARHRRAQEI